MIVMNCKECAGRAFAGSGHPIIGNMQLLIGVVAVLVLLLPWNAAAAEIVAFADGSHVSVQGYELKGNLVVMTCAFYLFIRQPMGRKSALRREIPWILRGFQGRLSC